jgi:hypothetical protein
MPSRYEKWLPKFTGNDVVSFEDHMSNFWAFFQLHPINDDVEDLAMKLFSPTLHDGARILFSIKVKVLGGWLRPMVG